MTTQVWLPLHVNEHALKPLPQRKLRPWLDRLKAGLQQTDRVKPGLQREIAHAVVGLTVLSALQPCAPPSRVGFQDGLDELTFVHASKQSCQFWIDVMRLMMGFREIWPDASMEIARFQTGQLCGKTLP